MGASGTLILRELSNLLPSNSDVEITIFESSGTLGSGMPYGDKTNVDCFLLNMRSWLLGANSNNIMEFEQWMEKNNIKDVSYPYLPRSVYGRYLQDLASQAISNLRNKNIAVNIVKAEIIDLDVKNANYTITTNVGCKYIVQNVILALGHLQNKYENACNKNYIANPYHNLEKIAEINSDSVVGILGTKLTAVDIAIYLRKLGVRKICMFSKSGLLPQTQQDNVTTNMAKFIQPKKYSLRAFFKDYMLQTKGIFYQPFLDSSKYFIDKYWCNLSAFQKRLFSNKYRGWWMSHRHPMPAFNSKKINDMLEDKSLGIYKGYKNFTFHQNQNVFNVELDRETVKVDYVIDASGASANVTALDSKLVQNLLAKNIVTACEFGGINIDCNTMQVGNYQNIYAIGHLTQGSLFYVASMERLLVHADIIAKGIWARVRCNMESK